MLITGSGFSRADWYLKINTFNMKAIEDIDCVVTAAISIKITG